MLNLEKRSVIVFFKDFTGYQSEEGHYNSPQMQNTELYSLGTGECI